MSENDWVAQVKAPPKIKTRSLQDSLAVLFEIPQYLYSVNEWGKIIGNSSQLSTTKQNLNYTTRCQRPVLYFPSDQCLHEDHLHFPYESG